MATQSCKNTNCFGIQNTCLLNIAKVGNMKIEVQQAGAELCQAQVRLEVIVEVEEDARV